MSKQCALASLAHPEARGGTGLGVTPASSTGWSCPLPRRHPHLGSKPPPPRKGCGRITMAAAPEGQPIHQRVAEGAPQNQPNAPAAELDAFQGQGKVQAKTIFAAIQPRAQGCSCPAVALMAGAGTSGTSSQGTRGVLEAESGWGRENIPLFARQHQWGAPCEVPAAWERRGAAGSPRTPGWLMPCRRQDGNSSEGVPNPAVHPHSRCITDSLSIFLTAGSISRRFCPCEIESNNTGKKILMRILQNKQEILWMLSGNIGQHLPKESCLSRWGCPWGA